MLLWAPIRPLGGCGANNVNSPVESLFGVKGASPQANRHTLLVSLYVHYLSYNLYHYLSIK
jgi:hypothetical protein